MTHTDLSIAALAALFLLALAPRAHLGFAAFPAAFIVSAIAGIPIERLISFFPSSFFILIVGVMSLFSVIQITGTMEWVLHHVTKLVGGRIVLLPLVPFVLGSLLTAVGTLPVAAIAIVAPIGMGLAKQYRLPAFLMAFAVLNGVISGVFSPIAVSGLTTNEVLEKLDVSMPAHSNVFLGLTSFVVGAVVLAILMAVYRNAVRQASLDFAAHGDIIRHDVQTDAHSTLTFPRVAALTAMVVLIVAGVVFELDLGFTALTLTFVLLMVLRLEPADIIAGIPWGVVVLIGGLLTYLGVMEELGAFQRLSDLLTVGDSALLGLLVLCYVAAITSFLANSVAVIVSTLPLLPPLIEAGLNPFGAVVAVLLSAVMVDLNPLGPAGGLIIGATDAEQRQKTFGQMLSYGLCAVVVAPVTAWAVFGLW